MSTATIESDSSASGESLYMSMELGEGSWKLGFTRGFGEKTFRRRFRPASSGRSEATIWRVGNGAFGFLHVAAAAWFFRRWGQAFRSLDRRSRIMTSIVPLVVAALILGQFAVALGFLPGLAPFFYLAMLLWILLIGLVQFVFLLVSRSTA